MEPVGYDAIRPKRARRLAGRAFERGLSTRAKQVARQRQHTPATRTEIVMAIALVFLGVAGWAALFSIGLRAAA